jgi:hypothetical protein
MPRAFSVREDCRMTIQARTLYTSTSGDTPPKPDDTIEGEGSPGLTITGGGGHA